MIIVIDTREQTPLDFSGYPVKTEAAGLASGDYSLRGFENTIALERKSEADLLGSLTRGRERFEAELTRLRGYAYAAVICETSWRRLARGLYDSRMEPAACMQSIIGLSVRNAIPFIMAETRAGAAFMVYHSLRHYLSQRERELKTMLDRHNAPLAGAS